MPDPEKSSAENDLVTLIVKSNEMEAGAVQAVLEDAGIDAFAFGAAQMAFPYNGPLNGVPVQVRQADLERAKAALSQNVADSVDLDWDEVDVGQREDDVPIAHRTRLPLIVRLGQIVVILMLAMIVINAIFTGLIGVAAVIVLGVLLLVIARRSSRGKPG
jgi:hypothetical protein